MKQMHSPVLILVALLALPASAATIKCWTNDEGVRECGNVVPPEYAQKGHEELSKQGIKLREVERAKTPEELEAERRAREQREAEARLMRKQAAQDQVLLRTYTSAHEIDLALEDKLEVLDSRIRLTKSHIEKFQQNLELLRAKAARQERSGKGMTEKVKNDIARVERQIEKNRRFVKARQREKEELRRQYAADKERFLKLKSGAIEPGDVSHLEDTAPPETAAAAE